MRTAASVPNKSAPRVIPHQRCPAVGATTGVQEHPSETRRIGHRYEIRPAPTNDKLSRLIGTRGELPPSPATGPQNAPDAEP